jgi:hypothetical protein
MVHILCRHKKCAERNNFSIDRLVEINNGVFSAKRIPEKWGGLSEPL